MTSAVLFFFFIPILAFILLAVNLIFAPHNPYQEKNSAFECGFTSFSGQNRTQFSISFFIFALLFLLFDLEILLVYPYLVSAYTNETYGLVIILIFLLALTLGFAFELGKKALSIDSRQTSKVNKNYATINTLDYNKVSKAEPFDKVFRAEPFKTSDRKFSQFFNLKVPFKEKVLFKVKSIFTKKNLFKFATLFGVGLVSRILVSHITSVNVVAE